MTGNHPNRVGLLPLIAAIGLAAGPTAMAQKPSRPAPRASAVPQTTVRATPAPAPSTSEPVTRLASAAQGKPLRAVHLAIDGNLPGRVVRVEAVTKNLPGDAKVSFTSAKSASPAAPTRNLPLKAKISFLQGNQVVNEVKSDEFGRFQVVGLRPGVYSVVAVGRNLVGTASVELLSYQPKLSKELTVLTIALAEPVGEDAERRPPEEYAVPDAGGMVGGTAGGGGGGGSMAALAGLAGLAGLGGLGGGGGGAPASPVVP